MNGSMKSAAMVLGMVFCGVQSASAHDYVYQPSYHPVYRTVVSYETRVVPKTVYVTQYDYCGRPYSVAKTVYSKVQVAVTKRIRVY